VRRSSRGDWAQLDRRAGYPRRIDDPGDFVRIEIEAALERGIPVVPILIDRATMPNPAELPPALAPLAYRNAIDLDMGRDFHPHVDRLVNAIGRLEPFRNPVQEVTQPRVIDPQTESTPAVKPTKKTSPSPQFTNSLGMTMVRIKPGQFLMGSTKAQIDLLVRQFPGMKPKYFDAEQPQHSVKITRPFYLAAHQLTVGQFRRFVESAGYKTEAESTGKGGYGLVGNEWKQDPKINWRNPGFPQGDDHPVVCVSHNDAVAFLGWLNQHEKNRSRGYRLPTEAEWEYACRAGTGALYGESDDPESLVRIANVADASLKKIMPSWTCIASDDGHTYTSPVGSFAPNGWHLYDMIGNVWEWCDDWFDANFYKSSATAQQEDPRNIKEAPTRVFRGGAWSLGPGSCRPADRGRLEPGSRSSYFGFRVAAVQE
jgi:formylglycine-generating enzyme